MYGNKSEKRERLEKMAALIAISSKGVTQATLARILGVAPSTIVDDLAALERLGILLAEDADGRLTLFRRTLPGLPN